MSTYKVIQDIEAEDKLVGPLSFRQFVYFLIAAFLGYLSFISVAKGAAFLLILFVPPMIFCLFFAWPWSPDQPTEVWALARIRFIVKSRKRVWDQSGIKEFVTITVPKKIERTYTDGLSQTEVRSRLQALAHTIDSRGWAVKNANTGGALPGQAAATDRLLDFDAMPQEVSSVDIRAGDDILDAENNPQASHMNDMIDASRKARRQDIMQRMQDQDTPGQAASPAPQWFARAQSAGPTDVNPSPTSLPAVAAVEPVSPPLTPLPPTQPLSVAHLKVIDPAGSSPVRPPTQQPVTAAAATMPQPTAKPPTARPADAAILNLAHDNNLDVATLAREAQRESQRVRELDASADEVVVSLR